MRHPTTLSGGMPTHAKFVLLSMFFATAGTVDFLNHWRTGSSLSKERTRAYLGFVGFSALLTIASLYQEGRLSKVLNPVFNFFKPHIKVLTDAELRAYLNDKNVVFIDVRDDNEWTEKHVIGIKNIPVDQLSTHQFTSEEVNGKIAVSFCRSGRRAVLPEVIKALLDAGFTEVQSAVSVEKFQPCGFPIATSRSEAATTAVPVLPK